MSLPTPTPSIRRRYRAFDLGDSIQKNLMLFAQSVQLARRHLMEVATTKNESLRKVHREAARSEARCARHTWKCLLESGYGEKGGVVS